MSRLHATPVYAAAAAAAMKKKKKMVPIDRLRRVLPSHFTWSIACINNYQHERGFVYKKNTLTHTQR
jgi:hypothetical protein